MDKLLFFVAVAAVAAWLWKPLRVYFLRRLDLTAKVLLIVLPALLLGRVAYNVYRGQVDDITFSLLVLGGLLIAWLGLWALGRWLDSRQPAPAPRPRTATSLTEHPALNVLSSVTGIAVPRMPGVSQETLDRTAVTIGRAAGRLAGRWRSPQATARPPAGSGSAAARPPTQPAPASPPARPEPSPSQETMDRAAVAIGRGAGRLVGKWRQSQRAKGR